MQTLCRAASCALLSHCRLAAAGHCSHPCSKWQAADPRQRARERASGAASHPNRGIGSGYALRTALAQADFRESTTVCASPECAALIDEHWLRRSSHRDCGWCRGHRGNVGKHIRYQLEMANALEGGRRRLAAWVEEDGLLQPYTLPIGAVTLVVGEARARVQHLRAHPPRRGRPRAAPPPPPPLSPTATLPAPLSAPPP